MKAKERAKAALRHFPMYTAMSAVDRNMLENLVAIAIEEAVQALPAVNVVEVEGN